MKNGDYLLKKKNKKMKRFLIISLVAMMFLSASAWLTSRQTANGVNNIKVGRIGIEFTNQQNEIVLNGNDAIPMTKEYAKANLTPYTFKVENTGTVAVKYSIYAKFDEFTFEDQTNGKGNVNLLLNDYEENVGRESLSYNENKSGFLDRNAILQPGETKDYTFYAFVDSGALNEQYLGKTAKFHLELDAVQADGKVISPDYNVPSGALDENGNIVLFMRDYGYGPVGFTQWFAVDDNASELEASKYTFDRGNLPADNSSDLNSPGARVSAVPGGFNLRIVEADASSLPVTYSGIKVYYDGQPVGFHLPDGSVIYELSVTIPAA